MVRDRSKTWSAKTETVSRETFIGRMVQHILPRGFQRIRYYGLQATCILTKMRQAIVVALQGPVQTVMTGLEMLKRLTYRQRLQQTFGRDPLQCPRGGTRMWLWVIWHPDCGLLYDEMARMEYGVYAHSESRPAPNRDPDRDTPISTFAQLPLFIS